MSSDYVYTMYRADKFYGPDRQVLANISLSFLPGAKIGVLGPNGVSFIGQWSRSAAWHNGRMDTIYALTSRAHPDRIMYVGRTRQELRKRLSEHRWKRVTGRVRTWATIIGPDNMEIRALHYCGPDEDPRVVAHEHIDRLNPPLNMQRRK